MEPISSPPLLLKLRQAHQSMLELDVVLFAVLKNLQGSVRGKGASIWLFNEMETELECRHTVGWQAGEMLGETTHVKKIIRIYQNIVGKNSNLEEVSLFDWMDRKISQAYFSAKADYVMCIPLIARNELLGVLIVVKTGRSAFRRADRDQIKNLAADIAVSIQNIQLFERQDKLNERLILLNQIRQHLHESLDLDELIPRIFSDVNKAINAEAQSIWLVDEKERVIKCRFATGPESEVMKDFTVSMDTPSIVGTSVLKKKSIIIRDAHKDPRRARSADELTGFKTHSLMTVPLVLDDKSIGAIQAVNKRGRQLFTQQDLDLFRAIADSAALAVNNAQLVAELQNSYDLTLEALSSALDLRDRETEGHSRRVVEYTARLAQQIGLDKETIKNIRRGALIHDVGKIGVPDAILHKPGALSEDEMKIIKRHPQAGHDMLMDIPYLQEEIQLVLYHHEKWDGTGYPFGLRDRQIALGARLFTVADTFDALTSDRPYRKSCSYEVACQLIEKESGKQFDPQIVAAFLAIPAEEWTRIRLQVVEETAQRRNIKMKRFGKIKRI